MSALRSDRDPPHGVALGMAGRGRMLYWAYAEPIL